MSVSLAQPLIRPPAKARVDRRAVWGAVGTAAVLGVWQLAGAAGLVPSYVLPTPSQIVAAWLDAVGVIAVNLPITLQTAALGYVAGNAVAIALAIGAGLWRPAEDLVSRLAVVAHCIPTIALAPILLVIAPGSLSGVILAALGVFFATLVGMLTGMRYPDGRVTEAHHAFGGRRLTELLAVKLPYGLPGMFSGLLLGVPAAMVGALMSEYLMVGRGMGGAITAAQEQLDAARVWALCLTCALVSAVVFALVAALQRAVLPWQTEASVSYAAQGPRTSSTHAARDAVVGSLAFLVVACALWWGSLRVFGISAYLGKTPLDVLDYLVLGPDAAAHTAELLGYLWTTLGNAALGLGAGTVAAVIAAAAFSALPALREAAMPTVLLARSIPLLAMIPAIALAFGSGLLTVVALTALLSFFPTLVTVMNALDAIPRDLSDLARAYNASRADVTLRIKAVYAVPAVFQSLRITATGALLGAVVAEWLASPGGIGYFVLMSASQSKYVALWSAVVVVTIVSMGIYSLVVALESAARRRIL
ncbi:ABC transporter permease [Microbacterium sp. 18062]|uniref:ABC transporter permease n=1 Tax=Microbacterium sp. 18062 TaxID=2681410 RepID=UPI00135B4DDA|nr:ABC transporter permease subunit [Microbacterium sp. 18062]